MGSTLSCAGKGHSPKDQDLRPYGAPLPKANGIVAPSEKYIVPSGEYHKNKGVSFFLRPVQPYFSFEQIRATGLKVTPMMWVSVCIL